MIRSCVLLRAGMQARDRWFDVRLTITRRISHEAVNSQSGFACGVAIPAAAILFILLGVRNASAHEGRDIGPYAVELGWKVEPAFVGVPNGPEIFIALKDDEDQKIEGAEKTLKLSVKFGSQTRELPLDAAWNDPGHYVADLTPTRAGDYSFHLTGTISDTVVDETFTSADGKFGTVEPASDILFPDTKLDPATLQSQIDASRSKSTRCRSKSRQWRQSRSSPQQCAWANKPPLVRDVVC